MLNINGRTKILIIAPHPDDESIGCGGLLSTFPANCEILVATNGALGNPEWTEEFTIQTRREEFSATMNLLHIETYNMLDIGDMSLKKNIRRIGKVIGSKKYDYIFVPNRKDNHPDHKCIFRYVKAWLITHKKKSIVVEYEVWTPLERPNYYLDISNVILKKKEAISCYKCQLKHVKYDWGVEGLNRYRGMLKRIDYAEAYFISIPFRKRMEEFIERKIMHMKRKRVINESDS